MKNILFLFVMTVALSFSSCKSYNQLAIKWKYRNDYKLPKHSSICKSEQVNASNNESQNIPLSEKNNISNEIAINKVEYTNTKTPLKSINKIQLIKQLYKLKKQLPIDTLKINNKNNETSTINPQTEEKLENISLVFSILNILLLIFSIEILPILYFSSIISAINIIVLAIKFNKIENKTIGLISMALCIGALIVSLFLILISGMSYSSNIMPI